LSATMHHLPTAVAPGVGMNGFEITPVSNSLKAGFRSNKHGCDYTAQTLPSTSNTNY
jgi:hypothetical protein